MQCQTDRLANVEFQHCKAILRYSARFIMGIIWGALHSSSITYISSSAGENEGRLHGVDESQRQLPPEFFQRERRIAPETEEAKV